MKKVDFILADVNTVKDEEKYYGSKIYKFPNKRNEIGKLTFGSKIKVLDKNKSYKIVMLTN